MDVVVIFFFLILLVAIALFVGRPFRTPGIGDVVEQKRVVLLTRERKRVLENLQELDFDYNMGKIAPQDYSARRMDLIQEEARILHQLNDATRSSQDLSGRKGKTSETVSDDELEMLVAARRAEREARHLH